MGSEVEESLTPEEKLRGAITGKMPWSYPVKCAKCNQIVTNPIYFEGKPYHLTHLPTSTRVTASELREPEWQAALRRVCREGLCYELAVKHILEFKEGTLIHGEVWSPNLSCMVNHAWVETETGYIYEPVSGEYFQKDAFYKTYKVREFKRYTTEQAMVMILKTKNYGPWEEEGGGTMESYLVSGKCETVLEDLQAGLVPCYSFREVRRAAACLAWQKMESEKMPWGPSLKEAWQEVKQKCTWRE